MSISCPLLGLMLGSLVLFLASDSLEALGRAVIITSTLFVLGCLFLFVAIFRGRQKAELLVLAILLNGLPVLVYVVLLISYARR